MWQLGLLLAEMITGEMPYVKPRMSLYMKPCIPKDISKGKNFYIVNITDLMHDDVTHTKGSMVVVVTLKSKMAASSASSERNSKSTGSMIYL